MNDIFSSDNKVLSTAQDPFNFDADPDPGSALGKNESGFIISPFSKVQIWVQQ